MREELMRAGRSRRSGTRVAGALVSVLFAAACGIGLGGSRAAQAIAIGPSCDTCQGSMYELSHSGVPIASTATTETWRITYAIDVSGYTGDARFLDAVALKVSDHIVSASLVAAPGGTANWVDLLGGLNANGCSGSRSESGFDCVTAAALADAPAVPGGVYTWVFDLEIEAGGLLLGVDEASLKARYVDEFRRKVGSLVSERTTLTRTTTPRRVPEPSTALLLALGSGLLGRRRARWLAGDPRRRHTSGAPGWTSGCGRPGPRRVRTAPPDPGQPREMGRGPALP